MEANDRQGHRRLTVRTPRVTPNVVDEAKSAEGRAHIAHEALLLFLRYGYHGTPVRLIAKASGISVGSIFNYFSGKEEILRYVLNESQQQAEMAVASAQRELESWPTQSEPGEFFLAVYRRYVEAIDRIRRYTLLAYQETKTLASAERKPLIDRDRRILGLLTKAAEPAVTAGIFPADALDIKISSLMHLAQMWAVRRWMYPQYGTIDDYWQDLRHLALGIMTAGPGRASATSQEVRNSTRGKSPRTAKTAAEGA